MKKNLKYKQTDQKIAFPWSTIKTTNFILQRDAMKMNSQRLSLYKRKTFENL